MSFTIFKIHKVADIELDSLSHIISIGEIYNIEHFPVGTVNKKEANKTALAKWWSKRSIPANRQDIDEVLDELNLTVPQELFEKSYGLSLSDQYWISPIITHAKMELHSFFFVFTIFGTILA